MSYSRPAYNAANATWFGAASYSRPAYNAADATFYAPTLSTIEAILADDGFPLSPFFRSTPWVVSLLADEGLPRTPAIHVLYGIGGWLYDGGLPSSPDFVGTKGVVSWMSDTALPSPLTGAVFTDPTPYIDPTSAVRYVMDLTVDGALVRVPISSWQATMQTDSTCYVQCVVPACDPWVDTINAASDFVVSRVGTLYPEYGSETVEGPLAGAPIQVVQISRGGTNSSAVLSGYIDALPTVDDPDALYDRELSDVRSISTYGDTVSVRCGIDWLLRPGQRAVYGATSFVVSYINYYVTGYASSIDAYMDVGHRS